MKKIRFCVILITLCLHSPLWAKIWGVKSHDPVSQPPATLFSFDEDGSNFNIIGVITLDGVQIDVDGLALSEDDTLYGFQVTGTDSRLITIDKTTAQAALIGNWLTGRDIRGATFDDQGQLITLNAKENRYILVRVNHITGNVISSTGLFNESLGDFSITNVADIVQRSDGAFVFTGPTSNSLWLYTGSSKVYELYTDATPAADGYPPALAGLALSDLADNPEKLFVYDVSEDDDIFTYQMDDGYTRQVLLPNIIGSYNAGRGDLASRPITRRTNLVNNPGFEEGPASVGNHLHLPAGSTELTGWAITQGAIDIVGEWEHAEGSRSLDLNGSPGVGAISQIINTIPGSMYRVRFKMAANTDIQPRISRMMVQANDKSTIQEFNNTGLGIWNMGWCPRVWYFYADGVTTVLTFASMDDTTPYYGPTLDAVEVSPAAWRPWPYHPDLSSCLIDTGDLAFLMNQWLTQCGDPEWDENYDFAEPGNGKIDLQEFMILAEYWLSNFDCPC